MFFHYQLFSLWWPHARLPSHTHISVCVCICKTILSAKLFKYWVKLTYCSLLNVKHQVLISLATEKWSNEKSESGEFTIYSVAIMVLYTECSKLKHILVCFTKGQYLTSVASVSHLQEHFRSRDLYKHYELTKSNTSYVSHNCVHIIRDLLTENERKLTCLRWMLACNEGEHIELICITHNETSIWNVEK